MEQKNKSDQKGFTLMEILMVVALMGILITLVLTSFSSLNKSQALDKSVRQVAGVVSQARMETLSSKNDTNYGVHFEPNQVIMFEGSTYSPSDSNNAPVTFNSLVSIYDISLSGGGNDVVFDRLTGATSQPGVVRFHLNSTTTVTKALTISGTGVIEVN